MNSYVETDESHSLLLLGIVNMKTVKKAHPVTAWPVD